MIPISEICVFAYSNTSMKLCPLNGTRIPIHIRSIMTFESEFESGEHAIMLEAAAEHVNNMAGILDEYQICFRWSHARVSYKNSDYTLYSRV